jgi:hypothetical protein
MYSLNLSSTLQRKSDLCIPRKETARPHSQFLHSFIYERFIYLTIGPPIFLQPNRQTDRGNIEIAHI